MSKPCLHILATAEQLEQMLRQEARTQGVAHAKDYILRSCFLEQCTPSEPRRLCSPQEQALVAWEIMRQHPRESRESEFDFRLAQLFVEQLKGIRLQGCFLEDWRQAVFKLKEHVQLAWFAQVWEAYASRLCALSLMDEVDMLYAAIGELEKQNIPERLRRVSKVFFHNLEQVTPLEQRFFFALDKALYAEGGELFLETCGVDNPELDGLVDELHAEFERAKESATSTLSLVRNVLEASSPAFELCKHLFGKTCPQAEAPPWECVVAANACAEAREAARRIACLLRQGVSPESIAVVLCSEATWAHAVWQELSAYSIVAYVQEDVRLSSCALGNAALSWLKWIEDGFPVEQAHTFFSNPLFEKTFAAYDDVGIWLQRAGIGPHATQESLEDYVIRLSLLQESGQLDAAQGGLVETLKKCIAVAQHAAWQIPEEGNLEEMLDSWWSSLQALGFQLNALRHGQFQLQGEKAPCPLHGFSFNPFGKHIHRKTWARENAAGVCFKQAFLEWKRRLQKTGVGQEKLKRREFSEWVLASFGSERVRIREPKTAGVVISHFKAMRSQQYKHIFFLGMKDKAFSQRDRHAFIPEALQWLVNASSAQLFFKMQRGESLHKLPEDIVLERRHFAEAVSCATERLWFSYSLAEHSGREAVPSVFWKEALRLSGKAVSAPIQASWFAKQPSECITDADFRGYVAQSIRRNFYERKQEAPLAEASLGKEGWFVSLSEKSAAERERFHFQCSPTQKAGPYTGKAWGPKTEKHLQAFAKLPWSAHAFGRVGRCAFWFFMTHVLKGGEVFERFNEEAGAQTKGVLLHRALALLGGDLAFVSNPRENVSEAQQRMRIAQAVEAAQKTLEPLRCLLHPELWALCCAQAEEALWGLWSAKSFFPWGTPREIFPEWRFEEEIHLGEGGFVSEKKVLKLTGRLDRFDILDGSSVGVVDYKLSKRGSKNTYKEGLLANDFQLLLYMLVLRKKGFQTKHAAWVFIQEKAHFLLEELMTPEALEEVLEEDLAARLSLKKQGKPNLLNRMEELVSKVEEGEFAPTPADCSYCPFKRACRVSKNQPLQADSL